MVDHHRIHPGAGELRLRETARVIFRQASDAGDSSTAVAAECLLGRLGVNILCSKRPQRLSLPLRRAFETKLQHT